MDALTPGGRAAASLVREKDAIAAAVTARLYAERPELQERFGATGRERCLEDVRYTVEHLIPAVDLGAPPLFVTYAGWLDGLLRARGVDTADVTRSLELIEAAARERLPADEVDAVAPVLRAGLAVLGAPGPEPRA